MKEVKEKYATKKKKRKDILSEEGDRKEHKMNNFKVFKIF